MTQPELISIFPKEFSIPNRVLLLTPEQINLHHEISIQKCRSFILVVRGSLEVEMGKTLIEVNANMLVDMLVWEPIVLKRYSDDLRAWCIVPNYLFTRESLKGLKPADSESLKDRHKIPKMHLEPHETSKLEQHLTMFAETLADFENFYRIELAQTYFRAFMLDAGNIVKHKKMYSDEIEKTESRGDAILRNFMKLVWQHYKTEHNVDFYAQCLCISSKHLARVIRDRIGKTPYCIIKNELLQQAIELLTYTKKSVHEISCELHFSEVASFCKFFKKHLGISPSTYRNKINNPGLNIGKDENVNILFEDPYSSEESAISREK